MDHLAFYNVGNEPSPENTGITLKVRRYLLRMLLPCFKRLVEILASICHRLDLNEHEVRDLRNQVDDLRRRQEEQASRIPATIAFGWDYVAMVRRLAVLEEHVDTLLQARDADRDQDRDAIGNGHDPEHASRPRLG